MDDYTMTCMFLPRWVPLAHLYLTTKTDTLPKLDHVLSPALPQIPVNEPVRLAPVPTWRKVKTGTPHLRRD